MSRRAEIRLQVGPKKHMVRLGIGELERIQEATDAGPFELYARTAAAMAAIAVGLHSLEGIGLSASCKLGPKDCGQIVYNGLIGGGMEPDEALAVTDRWIVGRPLAEQVPIAHAAILAAVIGVKDEPVGEPAGGTPRPRSRRSRTAS